MDRLRFHIPLVLTILATLLWPASSLVGAAAEPSATVVAALAGTPIRGIYVRPPRGAVPSGQPLQVLLLLHGMGGNGEDFARDFADQADRYGWLLVAPSIAYGDWKDPNTLTREDPVLINALAGFVDQLSDRTGFTSRKQVLILGHSRGAQLAHRFAEFRPDTVLAVAALSAGDYTLPLSLSPQGSGLRFPFGVKDLASYTGRAFDPARFEAIQFWVGVGADDTNPSDIPRQWDPFEGTTRLQRAQAFESAMQKLGASSVLRVFGGAQHELTPEMRSAACSFLDRATHGQRSVLGGPRSEKPEPY